MERTAERKALTPRLTKISSYYNFFKKGLRERGVTTPLHEIPMRDIMLAHYDIMRNHPDFQEHETTRVADVRKLYETRLGKDEAEKRIRAIHDGPIRWVSPKQPANPETNRKLFLHRADLTHRILCERAVSRALARGEIRAASEVKLVKTLLNRANVDSILNAERKAAANALGKILGKENEVKLIEKVFEGIYEDIQNAKKISEKAEESPSTSEAEKILGVYRKNSLHETLNALSPQSSMEPD